MKAGIGIIRKNNFFYTERGSWAFLEGWLIDAALDLRREPDANITPCPESCTACQKACPTGALAGSFAMDATRCVTARTAIRGIQAGDPLNAKMGGWVYGCDACQNACPKNRDAWTESEEFPGLAALEEQLALERLFEADDAELSAIVSPKLWYIAPADVWKFCTNALNALRNTDPERARCLAVRALNDRHEQVRALAGEILAE